jgi:hydroxylamine reductase (hybrid-cluster protein)
LSRIPKGPCRLPLPKSGIEGEDTRKGLCGASANTIAARNFIRMIAGGAAAHSDHGRGVAEVFLSVARKESKDYRIKDVNKLLAIAPYFDVATTVEVDGATADRNLEEIALEVAEKAIGEWGKSEGELLNLKRAPKLLYEKWKKNGVLPRNIDREIVEIMHRTHIGVDQDYKNRIEQENVIHIEFDEHHAMEDAERIVKMAIDNFENRGADVMIPEQKGIQVAGFGVESIQYHLGGTFRGSYYTLNDNIINGRIRGIGNDISELPAAGSAPEWMSERTLVDMATRRELGSA